MAYHKHREIVLATQKDPNVLLISRSAESITPPWEDSNAIIEIVSWDERVGKGVPVRDPIAWLEHCAKQVDAELTAQARSEHLRKNAPQDNVSSERHTPYMERLAEIMDKQFFVQQLWLEEGPDESIQLRVLLDDAPARVLTPVGYVMVSREEAERIWGTEDEKGLAKRLSAFLERCNHWLADDEFMITLYKDHEWVGSLGPIVCSLSRIMEDAQRLAAQNGCPSVMRGERLSEEELNTFVEVVMAKQNEEEE